MVWRDILGDCEAPCFNRQAMLRHDPEACIGAGGTSIVESDTTWADDRDKADWQAPPRGAGSSMSDERDDHGLIDVSELTIEELSAVIGESDLGRALDYILAASNNSVGFHGFNSRI